MATAPDPDNVLRSTRGKDNFHRVTRLLISGGTALLRGVFDQICPPRNLPTILNNLATVKQLKAARLTKPQWDCLYPSPGVYGKSVDFDVTLLFRLLRTICGLTPPATGWDALPASTDHSLAADLTRIKYYRNSAYGHVNQNMEIADDEFLSLWQVISEALVRIAGQISPAKKHEWQKAVDAFLKDPLTADDERNVEELQRWYDNDTEVKQLIEILTATTLEGMERVERSVKGVHEKLKGTAHSVEEKGQFLENAIQEEAKGIKELKEDTQDIKDKLDVMHQSILVGLRSQPAGVQVRLRMDCEAISGSGPAGVASEIAYAAAAFSTEPERSVQNATAVPVASRQQVSPVAEFRGDNVAYTGLPPTQGVLNFIAYKYFQGVDSSKPDELNGFLQYMRKVRKVLIVGIHQSSLIITLQCRSLEILDELWKDYCSGHLTKVAQKYLVTEELLEEFGLSAVKLSTTIPEEEYTACRQYFIQKDVHSPRDDTKRREAGFGSQMEKSESFSAASHKSKREKPNFGKGRKYQKSPRTGSKKQHSKRSMPVNPSGMQIVVEMPDGRMIPLKVKPSDTIKRVKQLIELKEGVPLYQQELTFASQLLEDDHTLSDCNIKAESTLHFILGLTTMQIFIKRPTEELLGTFKVEPETSISDLKKKIEKSGIPTEGKQLTFALQELKDDQTLKHYNITNESTLELSPKLSPDTQSPQSRQIHGLTPWQLL